MSVRGEHVFRGCNQLAMLRMLTRWRAGTATTERQLVMSLSMGFLASKHDVAFCLEALCDLCSFANKTSVLDLLR